jgi:nitroreductase
MNVTEAVTARRSIRSFLDTPVSDTLLRELLEKSARAPSGGNVQPWQVHVINGTRTQDFLTHLQNQEMREQPAYDIYPKELPSPYRDSRFKVGEDMYGLLGIPREDKAARFAHLARNYEFFGAPAAFFCLIDKTMGPPQWSDLGMFLQTFMLLAQEAGIDTCAQEAWATRPNAVTSFLQTPDNLMLFCGMAIGYRNPEAPVNTLVSDRMPLDSWATFV